MKNFHRIQSINVKVQKKRTVFSALLFNIFCFIGTSIYATRDASSLIQKAKTHTNKSYINSGCNTTLSIKLSRNIRLLLMVFFVGLFVNIVSAQTTKISTGSTDWNTASTWSPSGVPGLLDPVIIRPGDVVTVNTTPANAVAAVTFNNTSAAASGLTVASAAILTVTGAVSLLNSATTSTSASISGSGTLLCGSLNVGVPGVTTTNGTSSNTFTLSIKTLTVSGNITSNNDDPGAKASQPVWNISSPCTLSANSVVFTHTGTAAGGKTLSTFNLGSGATLNLSATVPIVVNYNVLLTSSMVTVNFPLGSTVNLCGASPAPTSIANTGSGGTDTPIGITYNGAINTGGGSITLTSGSGTNIVSTPTNVAMTTVTYSTTAATGATFSGLPPGVTGVWSGGVVTLSGTPTTVGVYNYTVTTVGSGSCGGKTANGTITTYVCPTYSLLSMSTSTVNVCIGSSSLITLTATAAGLPIGTYTVAYKIQGAAQTDATMTVTSAGTGSFVYTGFTSAGNRTITVTQITSGLCSSVINSNNIATITVYAALGSPTALAGSGATCTQITANWDALLGATYYELDVSASNTFATLLTGYNALNVGLVTTYNITGLSSGTTYYCRVRAFNGNCISASSSTITYATIVLPGTVTSNAATLAICDGFTANWTATANATSYLLDVSTSSIFAAGFFVGVYNSYDVGNSTTIALSGLNANTLYYYRVKAKNGCGNSASFSVTRNLTTANAVPVTVTSNAATLVICDGFTANWTATANATSYLLDVSTSSTFAAGFFVGVFNAYNVGNSTTISLSGLNVNTVYYYRVKAKNGCGNSASFSTTITTTTANAVPGTVTSNSATLVICDGFTANWTATANATSYLLDVSTSSTFATGFFVGVFNAYNVGNIRTISISGLNVNTVYYYRVKAKNGCGNSASFSTTITTTTANAVPGTVISSAASSISCYSFIANWTATANATSYLLDVSTSSTFAAGFFVGVYNAYNVGNSTTISLSGLNANTLYYYRVKAKNGCGNSASFSTTITTTTSSSPSTPTISTTGALTFCENNSVTLGANTGVSGSYDWYWNGSLISTETTGFLFVITPGSYTVRFTNASGCQSAASAASVIVVQGLPTATAGGSQSICANATATVSGATATNGDVLWTENGAGTITSGATTLTPTYTPAAGDIGNTVTLTMLVTSNNTCTPQTATATYTITVNTLPIITTQPINQLDCEGNIVSFNVVASGVGLTYVWQRKLPAEASFSNIPSEANVSYPTPDKIRIQSIGSALSVNGTQYQVVVSNGACSVKSSVATLSVNEITGVSPTATTVTQCYGTNYSYTASTSYPSNIVSYQWKSSVASGVWNDVVNGAHFSGATTATLNIINGTPTESAEYRVYITFHSSGADCNVTSASRTRALTFLPSLLPPATMVTQPTCSLATGTITVTIQSTTDTYSFDNGFSYQASNIKSGLAAGNRNVIIKNGVGCVSVSTLTTIDVQPVTLAQPILSVATQPTCVAATGSVVLSGLPATGIWTVTQSRDSSQTTGTGTSITITGLASGFYTYVVSVGSCTSVASAEVEIYATTNTWNMYSGGGSWANTLTSTQAITFNGDYNSTGDLFACSCRVDSGAVVINSGHTLKITNEINVSGGGSLTFENNASLVQINDAAVNYGNIIYKRTTTILANNYDFEYWGSPVQDQAIGTIWMASNWADTFYNFNPATNYWARNYAADKMIPGKGYITRARNGQSGWDYNNVVSTFTVGGTWAAKFYGSPNNGIIPVKDCISGKDCLIGNPYPSAIDADAFLLENSSVLGGTIYFWTHNTPMSNNAYNSNDYASYNGVGGTATFPSSSTGYITNVPSGKIAAGQAFFATAIATKEVIFNNSMRLSYLGAPIENTQFFKTSSNNKKTSRIEKHRVWLNLSNTLGVFKQTLVGYLTDATNDYDSRFDGESMNANTYADFYSINQNKNLTIQGRAVPFDENDTVPLGFKTSIAGSFTIDIDEVDGLLTNQAVYLEDKLTNTLFNLKNGNYTFTTASGTFNDRFVLRYTDKTLGTVDVEKPANQVMVSIQNKQIKITSFAEPIEKVLVYDLSGKQRYQKRALNSTELLITTLAPTHQILLLKTVLQNGKSSTKKVLF